MGLHLYSSLIEALRLPLCVTSGVSAHDGIRLYPKQGAREGTKPSRHTSGYSYSIPVAFTSNIVFGTQFEFLRFQLSNRQSVDDAFTFHVVSLHSYACHFAGLVKKGLCKVTLFFHKKKEFAIKYYYYV